MTEERITVAEMGARSAAVNGGNPTGFWRGIAATVSLETLDRALTEGLTSMEWGDAMRAFQSLEGLKTIPDIAETARMNAIGSDVDPDVAYERAMILWTEVAAEDYLRDEAFNPGLPVDTWIRSFRKYADNHPEKQL